MSAGIADSIHVGCWNRFEFKTVYANTQNMCWMTYFDVRGVVSTAVSSLLDRAILRPFFFSSAFLRKRKLED